MKRIAAFLFALFLLPTLFVLPARAEGLTLSAQSALLMEKTTGEILYAKDEHTPREPASVTKIMTLLLVMEAVDSGELGYDDLVSGSAHACSMGGSQIWLKEGEQLSVSDMLKAVCIVSANDCAVALGEHLAGSEEAFVEKMNRRAQELGMADTVFKNATGLPAEGHVTSAHDVAVMSRELILHHPALRQYTTVWMDTLRNGASSLVNTNKLIRFYDGATGLKTGSTDAALYCVSATAERDGMELIAVVLKAPTSAERFEDAKALLSYGFATYSLREILPEEPLPAVPVRLGVTPYVTPVAAESTLLLKKDEWSGLSQSVTLAEGLDAPVARGQQLGTLTLYTGGAVCREVPLLASAAVERLTLAQLLPRFLRLGLFAPAA